MRANVTRTITELLRRYELEPTIVDLYVEGNADKRVIQDFLGHRGALNIVVYSIDAVYITASELLPLGLTDNSRSRLVHFANVINASFGSTFRGCTFIIDRDFDDLQPNDPPSCPHLLRTDFPSIECYLFNPKTIERALTVGTGIQLDLTDLFPSLLELLQSLFAIRATNVILDWGMTWVNPYKCISKEAGRLALNEPDFIYRYLNGNARLSDRERFHQALEPVRTKVAAGRMFRGKDAFDLLEWVLTQENAPKDYCNHRVLVSLAVLSVDRVWLFSHALFVSLQERLFADAQAEINQPA